MKLFYNTSLPFQNNPKDLNPPYNMDLDFWDCFEKYLDPSYKMDLDFWDCFGRKQLNHVAEEIWQLLASNNTSGKFPFLSSVFVVHN